MGSEKTSERTASGHSRISLTSHMRIKPSSQLPFTVLIIHFTQHLNTLQVNWVCARGPQYQYTNYCDPAEFP